MNEETVKLDEAPIEGTVIKPGAPDAQGDHLRDLKKEQIGPLMVIWSQVANRKRLQDIRGKIRRAKKGWDGVLLHLLPGETIGSMKLLQVEALYERLMSMWDPDLYQIRLSRKTAALAEAETKARAKEQLTANQVADHLAKIQKTEELKKGTNVLEATAKLQAAKAEGLSETVRIP